LVEHPHRHKRESAMLRRCLLATALLLPCPAFAQEPAPAAPVPSYPIPALGDRAGYSILPYLQADALLIHRTQNGFDGNMDWGTGPRFVLGIPFGDCNAIEFAYFSIQGMNGDVSAAGPVRAVVGDVVGTGTNLSSSYHSFMQNAELNFRHFVSPQFSIMAGFRYVNWHETLGASFNPVNPFGVVTLPTGTITENYHTNNNVYGFQIGGDWKTPVENRFGFEISAKTGVFGVRAEMADDTNIPNRGGFSIHGSGSHPTWIGEIGLTATYRVTDYIKIRAGYQVMWLEGVALAPAQVDAIVRSAAASTIDMRGGVFLHGAVIGIDYRW
jgi:hypothetical protein